MLDIASRASRGVSLLSPKKTRARIIHTFKQQMSLLRSRLNVRLIIYFNCSLADICTLGPHCVWRDQSNL